MGSHIVPSPGIDVDAGDSGSACGVWTSGAETFLLSAAHVLDDPGSGPGVTWLAGYGTLLKRIPYWLPTPSGSLDAGFVLIQEPGVFRSSSDYPDAKQWAYLGDLSLSEPLKVCGKWGSVDAIYEGVIKGGQKTVNGHTYGRLIQYRYVDGETDPGDSGAPVLTLPDHSLFGIHVVRSGDGRVGWAVPAEDIVSLYSTHMPGLELQP